MVCEEPPLGSRRLAKHQAWLRLAKDVHGSANRSPWMQFRLLPSEPGQEQDQHETTHCIDGKSIDPAVKQQKSSREKCSGDTDPEKDRRAMLPRSAQSRNVAFEPA